jgi:tetrapyrrole methylase family protein/MazG family protein
VSGQPPRIVIAGLGPGDPALRTLAVQQALHQADQIILRTGVHPGIEDLLQDPRVVSCDDLYQNADQFSSLYQAIAERVVASARAIGSVVYAVPGHPRFAERTIQLVEEQAERAGFPVEVLDGISFVDVAASALHIDPASGGLQIVDAEHLVAATDLEPFAAGSLGIDPARPVLIGQLYNRQMAAAVKLALTRIYPDEHPVVLVNDAGIPARETTIELPLHVLDRQEIDHLTSLWIEPIAPLDAERSIETLLRIVARLRAPDGCPWDRDQTHASMRNAIIEEAYETVDAIDANDPASLAEELGDLLLLVAMHAQIAEEQGTFQIEDVVQEINLKLIRRHPHVFAATVAETPDAVISTWEGVKASERAAKGLNLRRNGRYERLPRAMPPTRKAIELLGARATLRPPADDQDGDQLLATIEELIDRGIDPEAALERALQRRALILERNETEPQPLPARTGVGDS